MDQLQTSLQYFASEASRRGTDRTGDQILHESCSFDLFVWGESILSFFGIFFQMINFFLFYGIIGSILLTFLVKYIFTKLSLPHFRNLNFINFLNSTFFIRNQNFLKQQFTSAGERV